MHDDHTCLQNAYDDSTNPRRFAIESQKPSAYIYDT